MKFFLLILFILTGCMEDSKSPEVALKDFILARMGKITTKEFIAERVTGKMKLSLEQMNESDFSKFADLSFAKQQEFKITSKSCQSDQKCFLTYIINFSTSKNDQQIFTSEVKKIAELQLVDGKWLIADVSNLKTLHESLEPIYPLE